MRAQQDVSATLAEWSAMAFSRDPATARIRAALSLQMDYAAQAGDAQRVLGIMSEARERITMEHNRKERNA